MSQCVTSPNYWGYNPNRYGCFGDVKPIPQVLGTFLPTPATCHGKPFVKPRGKPFSSSAAKDLPLGQSVVRPSAGTPYSMDSDLGFLAQKCTVNILVDDHQHHLKKNAMQQVPSNPYIGLEIPKLSMLYS